MIKTSFTIGFALALLAGCGSDERIVGGADPGAGGMAGMGGAAGASTGGASTGGADPRCAVQVGPIDPTALIDDLEDGNGALPLVGERNGGWYFASDQTPGASAAPAPDQSAAIEAEAIPGGRCGSRYAIRVTGQGYRDWGTVVGVGLNWERAVDVSAFRGIRFWARRGEQHSVSVRVQFQDKNSAPQGGVCMQEAGNCYDNFGTDLVPLDTEWQLYQIDFGRLEQRDFGVPADALDTRNLFTIEWALGPGTVFDFWVDDLWFYE